jgi:hypothetical protein
MVNENETSRRGDRPVEPPLIEGEAEEIKDAQEPMPEAPDAFAAEQSDHSETASPEPERPETRRDGWNAASLIIATLALVLAGTGILAVAGLIDFGTLPQQEAVEPRLAAVEGASVEIGQRIDGLTAAINRLHGQGPAVTDQQDGALLDQVQRLEGQVAGFTRALEVITASLKSIENRQMAQQEGAQTTANLVEELNARAKNEQSAGQPAPQNNAQSASKEVAGALLRVRQAVQEGGPFAQDLQALQNIVPEATDPGLAQLSAQGVLSMAELTRRLGIIADELKVASVEQQPAASPGGVWESFKSKAASLVSVRRLDEAQTLDQVKRATEFTEVGDLTGAVHVLSSAEVGKTPQIEAWLKDAQARLAALKGSEDLTAKVLAQLGSGS